MRHILNGDSGMKVYVKAKGGSLKEYEIEEGEHLYIVSKKFLESELTRGTDIFKKLGEAIRQVESQTAVFKYVPKEDGGELTLIDNNPGFNYDKEAPLYAKISDGRPVIGGTSDWELVSVSDEFIVGQVINDDGTVIRIGVGSEEAKEKVEEVDNFNRVKLTLTTDDGLKKTIELLPGVYYIGRSSTTNKIRLRNYTGSVYEIISNGEYANLARIEATLKVENGKVSISPARPEGNTKIKINGNEISEDATIKAGDVIEISNDKDTVKFKIENISLEGTVSDEERFSLKEDNDILKDEAKPAVEPEVKDIAYSLIEAGSPEKILSVSEEILPKVPEIGKEIESEVLSSYLPIITSTKAGFMASTSENWYDLIIDTHKRIEKNDILVSVDKSTVNKELLKQLVKNTLTSLDLIIDGRPTKVAEYLNLDEEKIESLSEQITERLLDDTGFQTVLESAISDVRYNLAKRDEIGLYKTYKHAIRLNGYATGVILRELSEKLPVDVNRLDSLEKKIIEKSISDQGDISQALHGIRNVIPAESGEKKKVTKEEELLVVE